MWKDSLSLDANHPAAVRTTHLVSSDYPGVDMHEARYLGTG